jgi:hypothetical protein
MHARTLAGLGLVTALLACNDRPAPTESDGAAATDNSTPVFAASTASQIARLRHLVAPFHKFEKAKAAGWSVQITSCLVEPGQGGMGFHYGKPSLINDNARVRLLEPELLLYEPQKNGKLRFVGVEYIVPFADHPSSAAPPTLLGQEFARVPEFGVWGLHIWVGRHNPSGIFSPWNPKVNCDNAPASQQARAAHHHGN